MSQPYQEQQNFMQYPTGAAAPAGYNPPQQAAPTYAPAPAEQHMVPAPAQYVPAAPAAYQMPVGGWAQPMPQSYAQRPLKEVGIAYLLWLILGLLGAHHFYLGKIGRGVAYLLTGGFLGIGLLIDLFTLASQVRQVNTQIAVGTR